MPKVKGVANKPQINKTEKEGYCRVCERILPASKFYEATNPMIDKNGLMSVCKQHCYEIYDKYFSIYNNMEKAIYLTCEDLDIAYNKEALKYTQSHIEGRINQGKKAEAVFGYYKSKLGSTGKNNANILSFRFKDSDEFFSSQNNIQDDSNQDIDENLYLFWGRGFDLNEYKYLSEKIDEYMNTYECETPAMEELLKQAAFESLEIRNKRQKREDVSKNLKNLQDLLGSANIKPNQESGANATDQATFGTLLKKWENEEPVPEPSEEWKDVDGIGRYIRIWFLGHLCKMMGITNDYSKEYEEEMAKLRVDLPSEDLNEDMDEGD